MPYSVSSSSSSVTVVVVRRRVVRRSGELFAAVLAAGQDPSPLIPLDPPDPPWPPLAAGQDPSPLVLRSSSAIFIGDDSVAAEPWPVPPAMCELHPALLCVFHALSMLC